MQSKTYRAKTMKEALTRVRRDLGGDAVILSAREVRRRRLFGLGPRALVEIVATDTMPSEQDFAGRQESIAATAAQPVSTNVSVQVGEQLGRLHAMVETLSRQRTHRAPASRPPQNAGSDLFPIDRSRRSGGADSPSDEARRGNARSRSVRSSRRDSCGLCTKRSNWLFPIAPPIKPIAGTRRVVALVGPTGVGKTTTVAKLAANFKLTHGARVGLITVDTYRIAAVEQLKTYAEIIDLPLSVVNDPAEMPTGTR